MQTRDFNLEVAARIKWLRKNTSMSQADVAEKIGIKQAGYGKIENGEVQLSSEYCVILAELFSVSCDFILRGNYEINATMFAEETLKKASEMLADLSTFLCNSGERMAESAVMPLDNVPY